ncbi:ankyrin repeat domain-containing protein 39 [Contarinia nasturtii]|uniref:ankyrin repeat domain-containing protein 39 n=1 Tax=Contarinia nasturtii TaxID=265458 RepID=UPI0012D38AF1|nr:ankyrin repeat domain-containing protein 39 [Contarinia nasturtii]
MDHQHDTDCKCKSTVAVQSLDEMDFERGIWSAALYNDLKKLDKYIAEGHTNNFDTTGYTAIHYAARSGHLTVCHKLLNAGAFVNSCTRSGNVTPLQRAALMGHEQIVQLLLEKGADVFHQDIDGNTALHKAYEKNHKNIINLLLDSSCDSTRLEGICNKKGLKAKDL